MRKILLLLLITLYGVGVSAETIVVEKPGRLANMIKKGTLNNYPVLEIDGEINNEDIGALATLSNLAELNFSKTSFNGKDYHSSKRPYYDGSHDIVLPTMDSLKKIKLPGMGRNSYSFDISNLKRLKVLDIADNERGASRVAKIPESMSLDTLIINRDRDHESMLIGLLEIEFPGKYQREGIQWLLRFLDPGKIGNERGGVLKVPNLVIKNSGNGAEHGFDFIDLPVQIETSTIFYDDIIMLRKWHEDLPSETFENVAILYPFALTDFTGAEITIPKDVRALPPLLFGESNSTIKKVNLSNVEEIMAGAFYGANNLTELVMSPNLKSIQQEGFAGTAISSLCLPEKIQAISGKAFDKSKIVEVEFTGKYPPELKAFDEKEQEKLAFTGSFIVPEGCFPNYNIGGFKNASILEKGANQDFEFTVNKPGSLDQYITDELAPRVINLTINGRLYDTDFEAIRKCKNLRVLDLANCFILESPETAKAKRDEDRALLELLSSAASMANIDANSKLNAGKGSFSEVAYTEAAGKVFDEALRQLDSKSIEPSKLCVFPKDPFRDKKTGWSTNPYLSKIVLPLQMQKAPYIGGMECLKEIILPPKVESIANYAIQMTKIESIAFPATLKVLGKECIGSESLLEVDLSNTQVEDLNYAFKNSPNIKVFKGSPVLKRAYGLDGKDMVGYFFTKEEPEGFNHSAFKTIHIPQGCKAGWTNKYNIEIIDDIEL